MGNTALTYTDAIDTMFGMVNAAWVGAASIVGYTPVIRWQGKEVADKPPVDQIWARVSAQIITDQQSSLANINGNRMYEAKGLLYIQLFCPRSNNDLQTGRIFSQYIREVFRTESPDGNIWFTNQRIVELAPDLASYPILISANFEYTGVNGQVNVNPIILALQRGGKHFPVEAIDGVRTEFTFVGLPDDPNFYLAIFNGAIQDGLPRLGQVLTVTPAPKPASVGYAADTLYVIW